MVIIWTHEDRTNQVEDANKGNICSNEANEDGNVNDKSISTSNNSKESLSNNAIINTINELQVDLENVNAIVHKDERQKVESCINAATSVICNGDFKNRSSHFSYKKQSKSNVNILIHRHTL